MWNRILFSCLSFHVGSVLSDSKPSPFAVTVSPTITGQRSALASWSYSGPSYTSSHTLTLIVSPHGQSTTAYTTTISTNPLETGSITVTFAGTGFHQAKFFLNGRDHMGSATTSITVVTTTTTSEPSATMSITSPSTPSPSSGSPSPPSSPPPTSNTTALSATPKVSGSSSSVSSSQPRSSTFTPTNSTTAATPSASSISTSSNLKSSRSSSPGTIAAIVLGTIIGLFVLFLFIYWLWRRRWQRVRRENEARATAFFPDLMLARPQAMPMYDEWEKDFYDASSTLAPSDSVSRFKSPRPAPGHRKVRPLVPSTVLTSLS